MGFSESERGRGFYFGRDAVESFLGREGLEMIIRSHEHCRCGFHWPFEEDWGCLTIFSSVNYCGEMNDGSVCIICEGSKVEIYPLSYESTTKRRRFLIPRFVLQSHRPDHFGVVEPSEDSTFHLAVELIA
jgi:hypothetical protein